MTRLWLIRHGPTHARGMCGWTDLPADLSDGPAIGRLASLLPDAPVLTSDLCRAVATADALAAGRPRLPPDPDLRELHFGHWEGRSFAEVEAGDAAALSAFWREPGESCATGGESWNAMSARVARAIGARLSPDLPDLIVVAHFGPILSLVQRARSQSPAEAFAQKIDPLSLTVIETAPAWAVTRIDHRP